MLFVCVFSLVLLLVLPFLAENFIQHRARLARQAAKLPLPVLAQLDVVEWDIVPV